MKRAERRHLKQNPLAAWFAQMRETLEARRRGLTLAALLVVALVAALGGYLIRQRQLSERGATMLADAMMTAQAPVVPPPPPPDPDAATTAPPAPAFQPGSYTSEPRRAEAALKKFLATAEAYPDRPTGITARYHAAATLAALGRWDEAERQYQEVRGRAGDGFYGRMAVLGLAETLMYAGKYDEAAKLFETTADEEESTIPADAVLMQLGRTYLLAGSAADAKTTLTRIIEEFPDSVYQPAARAELDKLAVASTP